MSSTKSIPFLDQTVWETRSQAPLKYRGISRRARCHGNDPKRDAHLGAFHLSELIGKNIPVVIPVLNSMNEGNRFSSTLGKSLFHFQNDRSSRPVLTFGQRPKTRPSPIMGPMRFFLKHIQFGLASKVKTMVYCFVWRPEKTEIFESTNRIQIRS